MTLQDYERIAGYFPVPGEPCPSCKFVCGPGGPDHTTTCSLVTRLWQAENNKGASIPNHPMELGTNPDFQTWAVKMSTGLFSQPRALPVVPRVDPAQVKAQTDTVSDTDPAASKAVPVTH